MLLLPGQISIRWMNVIVTWPDLNLAISNFNAVVKFFSFSVVWLLQFFSYTRILNSSLFQRIIKKYWGFCPPLINGCGIFNPSFGLLPRRTPINTVSKFWSRYFFSCNSMVNSWLKKHIFKQESILGARWAYPFTIYEKSIQQLGESDFW